MELNKSLIESRDSFDLGPNDLKACINSHGLYNAFQFVLRLSPEVHRKIAGLPKGITSNIEDFDSIQAYSTYFHETIHWWQHIGSTAGLILSLSYPAQAHANYSKIKKLLSKIGPHKSIKSWVEGQSKNKEPDSPEALGNIIVNNFFDIEFYRALCRNPEYAKSVAEHPYFDCMGHSYYITYSNILSILSSTIDEDKYLDILPDPREWQEHFTKLRDSKEEGFYYKSNLTLSPIGLYQIFEGQARFSQIQYLYRASGMKLSWEDFKKDGMLSGVYVQAFEAFLKCAEIESPKQVDESIIGLFLLICDIALNPAPGFPLSLETPVRFITDVDPGMRFLFLCRTVKNYKDAFVSSIKTFSRDEYIAVGKALTSPLKMEDPMESLEAVSRWRQKCDGIEKLMNEYDEYDYKPNNLPVRVLFSHFIKFYEDKFLRPEFFCWPGAWQAGRKVSENEVTLFNRHSALFVDKEDDDGVFPALIPGRDEKLIHKVFEIFYGVNVTYDMTRQWILNTGPFEYDYRWLSTKHSREEFKDYCDKHFKSLYGVLPDDCNIIE